MMGTCDKRFMFFTSALLSITAFVSLCVALSGDKWLYCLEKMSEDPDNRTELYRHYYMGLWYVCMQSHVVSADMNHKIRWDHIRDLDDSFECSNIPYFTDDDSFDSGNILDMMMKSTRKSTFFPFLSLLTLAIGAGVTLCGHCRNKGKKPLNFFSGIVFVSAGLLNLCGIIVYIAHVTEEVGHKARQPRDDPALRYSYGWCVALSAFSFALMEFAGAMFVYVYIKRFKSSFDKKQQTATANHHGGGGGGVKMGNCAGSSIGGNGPLLPPPPPFPASNLRPGERLDEDPDYHDTTIDSSMGVIGPKLMSSGGGGGGGAYHNLPTIDRHLPSASASSSPGGGNYHLQRGHAHNRSISRSQDFLNSLDVRDRGGGGGGFSSGGGGVGSMYDSRHASLTRGGSGGAGLLSSSAADYNFVSREMSRNTLSTTADYNKDFSYDTLHRTTPI